MQVLPRDAKMGTTVEHVKQLRDDITSTTAQSFRDTLRETGKTTEDRAARLETRMSSIEMQLAKIAGLLENGNTYYAGGGSGRGVRVGSSSSNSNSGNGVTTARVSSAPPSNGVNSNAGSSSYRTGE